MDTNKNFNNSASQTRTTGSSQPPSYQQPYQSPIPPQAPPKKMSANSKGCLIAAIIVIVLIVIVAIMMGPSGNPSLVAPSELTVTAKSTPTPTVTQKSNIEILSDSTRISPSGDYRYIVGEVKNNGTAEKSVKIIATIYDKNEKVIDTDTAYANKVPAGETRPFEFMIVYSDQYDHYKLQIGN